LYPIGCKIIPFRLRVNSQTLSVAIEQLRIGAYVERTLLTRRKVVIRASVRNTKNIAGFQNNTYLESGNIVTLSFTKNFLVLFNDTFFTHSLAWSRSRYVMMREPISVGQGST
jgi:hypothetical protein